MPLTRYALKSAAPITEQTDPNGLYVKATDVAELERQVVTDVAALERRMVVLQDGLEQSEAQRDVMLQGIRQAQADLNHVAPTATEEQKEKLREQFDAMRAELVRMLG